MSTSALNRTIAKLEREIEDWEKYASLLQRKHGEANRRIRDLEIENEILKEKTGTKGTCLSEDFSPYNTRSSFKIEKADANDEGLSEYFSSDESQTLSEYQNGAVKKPSTSSEQGTTRVSKPATRSSSDEDQVQVFNDFSKKTRTKGSRTTTSTAYPSRASMPPSPAFSLSKNDKEILKGLDIRISMGRPIPALDSTLPGELLERLAMTVEEAQNTKRREVGLSGGINRGFMTGKLPQFLTA